MQVDNQCYLHIYSEYNNLTDYLDCSYSIQIRGKNLRWHYCRVRHDSLRIKTPPGLEKAGSYNKELRLWQCKTPTKNTVQVLHEEKGVHTLYNPIICLQYPSPPKKYFLKTNLLRKENVLELHVKTGINV